LNEKLHIGIVFGGRSAEHEVSLVSASSIISSLDKNKYDITPIGISPIGQWFAGDDVMDLFKQGRSDKRYQVILPADPVERRLVPADPFQTPIVELRHHLNRLDVLFPVIHGTFGEDGTIQGLFEMACIPYVGAGVLGSAVSMDKIFQKYMCQQAGLPAVDFVWFDELDWNGRSCEQMPPHILAGTHQQLLQKIIEQLGLPLFIKPPNLGSSVGISKAHDSKELQEAIELALQYDRKVLIEKAVPNAREIEVSVLGNERPKASVAGEIIPSNEFYDYDAKYVDNASELIIPAPLPADLHERIRQTAVKAVMAVEAEGYARVDFLLDRQTNEFYLSEINTIPGFTKISMYPKLWEASGIAYSDLLDEMIRLALERHQKRSMKKSTFTPKSEWYR
jgi:D-alanine-D-alanine ligase